MPLSAGFWHSPQFWVLAYPSVRVLAYPSVRPLSADTGIPLSAGTGIPLSAGYWHSPQCDPSVRVLVYPSVRILVYPSVRSWHTPQCGVQAVKGLSVPSLSSRISFCVQRMEIDRFCACTNKTIYVHRIKIVLKI
jgi:hypothetical protein